ncbi:MAG TPA: hypothetical protein VN893_06100 [Bryobacteraceae bacterium]|nr:hypothetical protein [Bryobacteraceae bacterium]
MRRLTSVTLGCIAGLLSLAPLVAQDQIRWTKTVAPDGSFSLQQPESWEAKYGRWNVRLSNAARDEEILVIRMPRDPAKPVAAYAEAVERSFQQALASFRISHLTTAQDSAAFLVTYASGGKSYSGPGAVVLKENAAWWVSYGSPAVADLARGAALITGVAGSAADGAGNVSPAPSSPPAATGPSGPLVGNWSTSGYYGELVNPSTGAFLQSSYSGQWYSFRADGTYQYTIAGSGQIITGIVIAKGTYEVRGKTVLLHQKTESWYPMPRDATHKPMYQDRPTPEDSTIAIEFRGPETIVVRGIGTPDTFHRQPNGK